MPRHSRDTDPARFVRLFAEHERRIRVYLFCLLPSANEVDEVMQEVSAVLWEKFDQLEDDSGFLPWAYQVAKYEVLMFRRSRARDRLVFSESTLKCLTSDYSEENEGVRDSQRKALEHCLSELREADKRLLMASYNREMKISQLADELKQTANSLYKSVGRLRQRLVKCMQKRIQTPETT